VLGSGKSKQTNVSDGGRELDFSAMSLEHENLNSPKICGWGGMSESSQARYRGADELTNTNDGTIVPVVAL
jgi:hypothetical protein